MASKIVINDMTRGNKLTSKPLAAIPRLRVEYKTKNANATPAAGKKNKWNGIGRGVELP